MAGANVAAAAANLSVPLVTTFYGVDATACLRSPLWRDRYRQLFRLGALFVVLTDEVIDPLVAAGCPRERIVVWDVGIDFSQYPVVERGSPGSAPRILCVARFVEKKGHELLIPAFANLRRLHPTATLTLIGYGPLLPEIVAAARRHGLDDTVTLIDTEGRTDFYELFRDALITHDVFALPCVIASNGDAEAGPPLTLVCAQATAMPVVTTMFVGADRCVRDSETAIVCEPTVESLSAALRRVLDDRGTARAIGLRASETVRRKMSLSASLTELDDHYRKLVHRGSR
jgi:glycosyltransferase involved in cell wall biosynthesis